MSENIYTDGIYDAEKAYTVAVGIVTADRKAATSYIQRKLAIGYNQATYLMERMVTEGVISEANHIGKREILKDAQATASHPQGKNGGIRELVVSDTIELFARLLELYEPQEAVDWMNSPHPQLENETPANLIAHGHSDKVNRFLLRLEADAYI